MRQIKVGMKKYMQFFEDRPDVTKYLYEKFVKLL